MRNYVIALALSVFSTIVGIAGAALNAHSGVYGWFIAYALIFGAGMILTSKALGEMVDALREGDE